jgi:hypothetical protein
MRQGLLPVVLLSIASAAHAGGQPAKLPPDLDLLPREGAGLLSVRVADLWQSEATACLRDKDSPLAPMAVSLPLLEKMVGIKLTDVERATVFFGPGLPTGPGQPVVVVRCARPIDRDRLLKSELLAFSVPEQKLNGRPYYVRAEDRSAVFFPDDQTLIWANVPDLEALLKGRKKGEAGPLALALQAAAVNQLTATFELSEEQRSFGQSFLAALPRVPALKLDPVLAVRSFLLTADLHADARFRLALTFAKAEVAADAEKAIRRLREQAVASLPDFRDGLADAVPGTQLDGREWPPTKMVWPVIAYLKTVEDGLKKAEIRREDEKVEMSLRLAKSRGLVEGAMLFTTMGPLFLPLEAHEMPLNPAHAKEMSDGHLDYPKQAPPPGPACGPRPVPRPGPPPSDKPAAPPFKKEEGKPRAGAAAAPNQSPDDVLAPVAEGMRQLDSIKLSQGIRPFLLGAVR